MFTICLYRIFESGFILVLYYLLNLREAESISSVLDQRSWLIVSNTELQTQIHTHTHTLLNVIKIQNFNYVFWYGHYGNESKCFQINKIKGRNLQTHGCLKMSYI